MSKRSCSRTGVEAPPLDVKAAEPLPGDDFYLVSDHGIAAMRDGKVVQLRGTELTRVRRWVANRAR